MYATAAVPESARASLKFVANFVKLLNDPRFSLASSLLSTRASGGSAMREMAIISSLTGSVVTEAIAFLRCTAALAALTSWCLLSALFSMRKPAFFAARA